MAIIGSVGLISQERPDMDDFVYPTLDFDTKIRDDIYRRILTSFQIHTGADIRPNSNFGVLVGAIADQFAAMYQMNPPQTPSVPKYKYPDGVVCHGRPIDGQTFRMNGPKGEECYMWDDMLNDWKWIGTKLHQGIESIQINIDVQDIKVANCECGSEKAGSNRHSSWCPKHSSDG